jgi:hypothetical protein
MSLHLHIERLVLDGLPFDSHEAWMIRSSMEAALLQLFHDNSTSREYLRSSDLSNVYAGEFHFPRGQTPTQCGVLLATAVQSTFLRPQSASRRHFPASESPMRQGHPQGNKYSNHSRIGK